MSNSDSNANAASRSILHIDLDSFFASVEVLDDPQLRGRPVAVGGDGDRGVVASANYEARRYGVYSAMPMVVARRRCPDLVIRPGRFDRYEEMSARFHAIVFDLTPVVEPLGLDEVFADLTSVARFHLDSVSAAHSVRQRIADELSLDCGIGVGRNKLFAKLASKKAKPRVVDGQLVAGPGVFLVTDEVEREWLDELPVRALWGVGPATAKKLDQMGLRLVRDIRAIEVRDLLPALGPAVSQTLWEFAHGIDTRTVEVDRVGKSIGHDATYPRSIPGATQVRAVLLDHATVVARNLRERELVARTITLVLRFDDFRGITRSHTLAFGVDDARAIEEIAAALLESVSIEQAVRLVGIHASGLRARAANQVQLTFDVGASDARDAAQENARQRQVDGSALRDAIDEVRQRFGQTAVATLRDLHDEGVELGEQRGRSAFSVPSPRDVAD